MTTSLPPVPRDFSPAERAFLEVLRRAALEQGQEIETLTAKMEQLAGESGKGGKNEIRA